MRSAILLALLLVGCDDRRELTQSEAIAAADAELFKVVPQMRGNSSDVKVESRGEKWRVDYGGGTGGVTVDVDKRTGKAIIVDMQQ